MHLFEYRTDAFYLHHSLDERPDPRLFPMHAHDQLELYYFIRGNGHYMVEGTEYRLQSDDLLLMREAETHRLMILPDMPYERISLHFSKELLLATDPDLHLLRPFYVHPLGARNQYRLNALKDSFWRDCLKKLTATAPDAHFETRLIAYLLPLLLEINACYERAAEHKPPAHDRQAAALVRYINQHLFEPLSLELLGNRFYLSKSQLNRVFRKATGSSIAQYIEIKRLIAVRGQIRSGERAGAAAANCGFNDYSAFYRAYKKQFGVPPSADL